PYDAQGGVEGRVATAFGGLLGAARRVVAHPRDPAGFSDPRKRQERGAPRGKKVARRRLGAFAAIREHLQGYALHGESLLSPRRGRLGGRSFRGAWPKDRALERAEIRALLVEREPCRERPHPRVRGRVGRHAFEERSYPRVVQGDVMQE